MEEFLQFLSDDTNYRKKDQCVYVTYSDMQIGLSPGFLNALSNEPSLVYPAMELAIYRHFKITMKERQVLCAAEDMIYNVRILDWPLTGLKHVKAHCVGKLINISGTVIRATGIKPRVITMYFKCPKCGQSVPKMLEDGRYSPPTSCPTPQCRSKKFEPELEKSKSYDWQTVRVQENVKGSADEVGRMPRMIEVDMVDDLADSCVPGDTVNITGIVKREAADKAHVRRSKNKNVYYIFLEAKTVINTKQPGDGIGLRLAQEEYDAAELQAIKRIAANDRVFLNIVNSLCPSIYGHELVKAGLCLALFGGTHRKAGAGTIKIRGDPHVLIVGDPGLGKSQMLRAISNVAPRGVYVCGSYSSSSGLTVTLMKEAGTGDYVLEAGALVLADQGVCCIDEFDKMPNEHQSLLEAMEQQTISVAKAGIVCSLMARTSVIAAANPVGGHYDRSKTIAENLKISPALLSRFDLIFILLDKPDEALDKRLSEHVMALHGNHGGEGSNKRTAVEKDNEGMIVWQSKPIRGATQQTSSQVGKTLCERLKVSNIENFMAIPPKALRKYISYARKYVNPRRCQRFARVLSENKNTAFHSGLYSNHQPTT